MTMDNHYHHQHQASQNPGGEQVSATSQRILEMVRRITEPLYPALRWLRFTSRFDLKPQTFTNHLNWLENLIERLQSVSHWSTLLRRQESLSQPSYFVWFDPRYWINRIGREDNLENYNTDDEDIRNDRGTPEFIPTRNQIIVPSTKQPFIGKQTGLHHVRQFKTLANLAMVTNTPVTAVPEPNQSASTKQQINTFASTTPAVKTMSMVSAITSQSADATPLPETTPVEGRVSKFTRVISKVWDKISSPLATQLKHTMRFIGVENTKSIPESSLPSNTVRQITSPTENQSELSQEMVKESDERILPEQSPDFKFPMHIPHVRLSDAASAEITMPDEAVLYSSEQTEEKIPAVPIWTHSPIAHRIPSGITNIADTIGVLTQETGSRNGEARGFSTISEGSGQRAGALNLALAPTVRSTQTSDRAAASTASSQQQTAAERTDERTPSYDPELVAAEVYAILKKRLVIERERAQGIL
jgi:hypothetical protein